MDADPSRRPDESKTRPPIGPHPPFPLPKECSTVSSHFPLSRGVNLKAAPQLLYLPPAPAVPYRFPLASRISPDEMNPPPGPLSRSKVRRTVSFHLPPPVGV